VDGPALALIVTIVTHLMGAALLVAMLIRMDGSGPGDIRRGWWDDGGPEEPSPEAPDDGPGGRTLPLPDAVPSATRRRSADDTQPLRPRPSRRPEHRPGEPQRVPGRVA
jgi:hypothetical protein